MSADSHESYTRKWADTLEIPLISINYGLAPEHPYPQALNDCWQSYIWLLTYAQNELNITMDKIIFTGDSAGGCLVLGLTALCLVHKVRPPDALFLFYPAVRGHLEHFTPSLLISLGEMIIPYHFLDYCFEAYNQNYDNKQDYFLNPINLPPHLLKQFPYTRIFGGSTDPLRDDFIRLTQKLVNNDVNCKYVEFKYFPHGFLNFDTPILMPEVSKANEIIIEEMSNFINQI